ncbi:hypothetical protein OG259_22815 [Streptomyces sp. NBC_00250]|uniref:hypothetical protein n=1 Tax=Streptomyces sp. NBC_00250 TaxID=2903641 RepID=UPI002E2E68B7|nr:hypothetical protein [Streptomyces sp. NBC_00250]
MLTPNRASAVPAAAALPTVRRPYAAAFRSVVALSAATGLVIECVLGAAFYALGLAIVGLDRIRPAPRPRENRISSQRARGLK